MANSPRVPVSQADFGAVHPEWVDRCRAAYAWPDGTIEQESIDGFARLHPLRAADNLAGLNAATDRWLAARAAAAEANAGWVAELRAAYRAGATAAELAAATSYSSVRISQLVAGARKG